MEIEYQKGFAIDKPVDVVVNSANGFLLLGSSGAGRIRDKADRLGIIGHMRYDLLLLLLPRKTRQWFVDAYRNHGWRLSKAQLYCMQLLFRNNRRPYRIGSVVLDGNRVDSKTILHAVSMSYDLERDNRRIPATADSLREVMEGIVRMIPGLEVDSIAIPIMCARKGYGSSPERSLRIIESSLRKLDSQVKVILCFDNDETEAYLRKVKA